MLLVLTDCQGSQDITLIMDVYRLALKVNLLLMTVLFQYFHLARTNKMDDRKWSKNHWVMLLIVLPDIGPNPYLLFL